MDERFPYYGLYINLDRSTERRGNLEKQLQTLGLSPRYERFPAIDGSTLTNSRSTLPSGETGCFHSHYRALQSARQRQTNVHILEDDAVLSAHVGPVLEDAIANKLFDHFDVVFTDTFVNCHLGALKSMKATFDECPVPSSRPMALSDLRVIDLSQQNFACLTSYMVGAKSIDRVLALYQQEIALGPRTPVDIFIRDAVHAGKLRAACIFPFITTFSLDEVAKSTLDDRAEKTERPSVMVLALLRHSFFVDRDLDQAKRYLDAATASGRGKRDAHRDLIVEALDFVMSDEFKDF